jgi:predicted transcriptional regulator
MDEGVFFASRLKDIAIGSRLDILHRLSVSDSRTSLLASEMNKSMSEVHRNVTRLMEMGLIERTQESELRLSHTGRLCLQLLSPLEFICKHEAYFRVHTLSFLPDRFVHTIGALRNCKIMYGAAAIFEKTAAVGLNAQHGKAIAAQITLDHIRLLAEFIKRGDTKGHYIFGENTVVPKGRRELLSQLRWKEYVQKGIVERRMVGMVSVHMVVAETEACVMFPYVNGEVDMNTMFYGKDKEFISWCDELFTEIWNGAGIFDESKLVEIG